MNEKRCFKCGEIKPIAAFYQHPRMADGHLNKCKECAKHDVANNYQARKPERLAYEKARASRPERKRQQVESQRRMRARRPEKSWARGVAFRAVRNGSLVRQPCVVCGDPKSEAHHEDHNRPLDVVWLCFQHHREADRMLSCKSSMSAKADGCGCGTPSGTDAAHRSELAHCSSGATAIGAGGPGA